jgi:NADH dehydrogenase FAD-containing subunit
MTLPQQATDKGPVAPPRKRPDIVIVGGGAGGLELAIAADNPHFVRPHFVLHSPHFVQKTSFGAYRRSWRLSSCLA